MLIGIDASRAGVTRRTGTEMYSVHVIREMLRQGQGHRFRLYTNGEPPEDVFVDRSSPASPCRQGIEPESAASPEIRVIPCDGSGRICG